MHTTEGERQELSDIREAVRSAIEALECCWSCQTISECGNYVIDDGPAVPLCLACLIEINTQTGKSPAPVWPFAR